MATTYQYCLNASTIRPAPLMDKIRIAGEAGYAAIELWHDEIDHFAASGGNIDQIRRALQASGLTVPTTIHLKDWFHTTGLEHEAAVAECKRKLEQAAQVGARYAIAGPPHGDADPELGGRHYRELLEIGKKAGAMPAMEFLGFVQDIKTIEDGWEIVSRAADPAGTLVMDPFHVFRGGGSMESILGLSGERIAICHFNDAPADPPREQQRDPDRVYPGDGIVDLRQMVRNLNKIGYAGFYSLELFNESYWAQDPLEVAKIGLDKMRSVIESA